MSRFEKALCLTLIAATVIVLGFAIVRPARSEPEAAVPVMASPVLPSFGGLLLAPTGTPERVATVGELPGPIAVTASGVPAPHPRTSAVPRTTERVRGASPAAAGPATEARVTAVSVRRISTVADARRYALTRLGASQYRCLDILWQHESQWNPRLLSRSGAYGIPQALPGSKMRSAGADWRTNPMTQVRWGLGYIRARYGTACMALAHWNRTRWY